MNDSRVGFFDRLELQLRAAAQRPARRTAGWRRAAPWTAAAAVAIAVVALSVAVALALLGGDSADPGNRRVVDDRSLARRPLPVGSVIPRNGEERTVVATGSTPISGPWQAEAYREHAAGRSADR